MTVQELIEKLQGYESDKTVVLYDHRKNVADDDGDGTGKGVYSEIQGPAYLSVNHIDRGDEHVVAIGFDNEEFPAE